MAYEATILNQIRGCKGVIRVIGEGYNKQHRFYYMVGELLGPTLEDLFEICER